MYSFDSALRVLISDKKIGISERITQSSRPRNLWRLRPGRTQVHTETDGESAKPSSSKWFGCFSSRKVHSAPDPETSISVLAPEPSPEELVAFQQHRELQHNAATSIQKIARRLQAQREVHELKVDLFKEKVAGRKVTRFMSAHAEKAKNVNGKINTFLEGKIPSDIDEAEKKEIQKTLSDAAKKIIIDAECGITLEKVDLHTASVTRCGHIFQDTALTSWRNSDLQRQQPNSCPTCRESGADISSTRELAQAREHRESVPMRRAEVIERITVTTGNERPNELEEEPPLPSPWEFHSVPRPRVYPDVATVYQNAIEQHFTERRPIFTRAMQEAGLSNAQMSSVRNTLRRPHANPIFYRRLPDNELPNDNFRISINGERQTTRAVGFELISDTIETGVPRTFKLSFHLVGDTSIGGIQIRNF